MRVDAHVVEVAVEKPLPPDERAEGDLHRFRQRHHQPRVAPLENLAPVHPDGAEAPFAHRDVVVPDGGIPRGRVARRRDVRKVAASVPVAEEQVRAAGVHEAELDSLAFGRSLPEREEGGPVVRTGRSGLRPEADRVVRVARQALRIWHLYAEPTARRRRRREARDMTAPFVVVDARDVALRRQVVAGPGGVRRARRLEVDVSKS